MSSNPEYDAVWSAIPERAKIEATLVDIRDKRAALEPVSDPDEARQEVINSAAQAVADGKAMPRGVGAKAAKAYTDALAKHAEWQILRDAEDALKARLERVRDDYREDALEELGKRLDDVMQQTRAIVERVGHVVTADAAIEADAVDEWRELRRLLSRLDDIRSAQRSILMPTDRDSFNPAVSEANARGHAELRGLAIDPAPSHLRSILSQTTARTVEFLVWLAESGRAWVPESESALLGEMAPVDVSEPDGSPTFQPREIPNQPRGPVHRGGGEIPTPAHMRTEF